MKTPKHVLQQDPLGCLGATMAMVLGITYEAACDLMGGRPREKHSFYCDVWDQTLEDNGWAVCRRWVTKQPGNVKRDPWPLEPWADLHECEVQTSMIHSVLLLRDGTVLDPLTPEPKRLSDYNGVLSMAALYNVAHLQSQLDECRKERDEAKAQRDANAESMRFIKEQRDQPIWEYSRNAWSRVMSMFVGTVGKDATDHVCDSITTLRTALAASHAQVGKLQKDKERLESMRSSGF